MVPPRELKSEAHKKSSAIDLPKGLDGCCPSTDRIAHIAREYEFTIFVVEMSPFTDLNKECPF